jgi:signal transduction histidine kinase
MLSEISAGMLAARFDAFYMTEQLRQTAATEERIRLARDLHDGVLQSFTGIALKMAAARRIMQTDSAGATAALEDVQQILASAQRDLRFFIEDLKPNLLPVEKSKALDARLAELARRMEREWDLRVRLQLEVDLDQLTSSMCWELYHLVREALINAARHGAASAAHVRLVPSEAGIIAISIADNGHGFAFSGRYTGDELATLELGPKTLRERVTAMHGSLTLESGPSGSELHITLPIAA